MAKHERDGQSAQQQPGYPPPSRSTDAMSMATLAGAVFALMISFANWREIDRIQESLDVRLAQLDTKIGQIPNRPTAPQRAQARRGPDPSRVYQVRTNGAPVKGPANAPVTIVEFSDFQ